jgi:hypothetical protein
MHERIQVHADTRVSRQSYSNAEWEDGVTIPEKLIIPFPTNLKFNTTLSQQQFQSYSSLQSR